MDRERISAAAPTLLVNLNTGRSNAGLLTVAGGLAEQLGAFVIGVTARQPVQLDVSGTCYMSQDVIDGERKEIAAVISAAEAEFRTAFQGHHVDWRSSVSFRAPSNYIVDQSRHADLLLTGIGHKADLAYATPGELVMQCGRPVLVVPPALASASVDRVMLAWKDTREARRAALDALPLMKKAAFVAVVEIAADETMPAARQRVEDVSRWLAGHGVLAEPLAAPSKHGDPGQLQSWARKLDANLVVAGAYGHSRLREWAFGGITRALLQQDECCALLSH